jgi:hypothetical protein
MLSTSPPVIANPGIGPFWSLNRVALKAVDGPRKMDKAVQPSIRPFPVKNSARGADPLRRTLQV